MVVPKSRLNRRQGATVHLPPYERTVAIVFPMKSIVAHIIHQFKWQ
jgi:hypothetical protein